MALTIRQLRILILKTKMKLGEREAGLERMAGMHAQYKNLLTKETEAGRTSPYTIEMVRFSQTRVESLKKKCRELIEQIEQGNRKQMAIVEKAEREAKADSDKEKNEAKQKKQA